MYTAVPILLVNYGYTGTSRGQHFWEYRSGKDWKSIGDSQPQYPGSKTCIPFLDALNILWPCWNAIHNAAMLTLLRADSCHCKGLRHPVLATLPPWRTHPGHRRKPYQTLTLLASLPWMPQPLELKEWIYHLSLTHCKVCVGAAGRDMRQQIPRIWHWQYYSNQSW